jgi:hypothetical protein
VIRKGLEFLATVQNPDGGWRYVDRRYQSDSFVTIWGLRTLLSAKDAGIEIDGHQEIIRQAFGLLRRWTDVDGVVGYQKVPETRRALPLTLIAAAASLSPYMPSSDGPEMDLRERQIHLLREHPPLALSELQQTDLLYLYFTREVFFGRGGEEWRMWDRTSKRVLLSKQTASGRFDVQDPYVASGGPYYATAIGLLALQIYYR